LCCSFNKRSIILVVSMEFVFVLQEEKE